MKEVKTGAALKLKRPNPVTLCTCIGASGRPNIITLAWEMQTSIRPLMFAISVAFTRYSYELIEETGEFVIAWPTELQAEGSEICGTQSGRDIDKFAECGFEAVPATKIKPPLIGGCLANFECRVVGKVDSGDHRIFVGECVAAHVDEKAEGGRLYMLDGNRLGGLSAAES